MRAGGSLWSDWRTARAFWEFSFETWSAHVSSFVNATEYLSLEQSFLRSHRSFPPVAGLVSHHAIAIMYVCMHAHLQPSPVEPSFSTGIFAIAELSGCFHVTWRSHADLLFIKYVCTRLCTKTKRAPHRRCRACCTTSVCCTRVSIRVRHLRFLMHSLKCRALF